MLILKLIVISLILYLIIFFLLEGKFKKLSNLTVPKKEKPIETFGIKHTYVPNNYQDLSNSFVKRTEFHQTISKNYQIYNL